MVHEKYHRFESQPVSAEIASVMPAQNEHRIKVAIIGAGSTVFTYTLVNDLLSFKELGDSEIALMDIDPYRLEVAKRLVQSVSERNHVQPKITSTLNRKEAIEKSDYVINTIQVGGFEATLRDFEIPKKYKLRQTIGDTLGVGGIMRGLRTIPVVVDMLRDIEDVASKAKLLNYANPLSIIVWAANRVSEVPTLGLCHSVSTTARELSRYLNISEEELRFTVAGINHLAFFLKLENKHGQDLYPELRQVMLDPAIYKKDAVRFALMKMFGYFVTESSIHAAEYMNYFIRKDSPELIARLNIPLDEYIRRSLKQNKEWEQMARALETAGAVKNKKDNRLEYAPLIIHSEVTNTPRDIYINTPNTDCSSQPLINNLPKDCVVEIPSLVDGASIHPYIVEDIPPQLVGLITTNINTQRMTVEAALTNNRDAVYQAAFLDPHTTSELKPDEIVKMVDELLEAHGNLIPKKFTIFNALEK